MIRIRDIADKLELSRVTVSAILNNRYKKLGISEKTADRVRSFADELGYLPNKNALSMKQGRSMTIGILSSALAEGWGARIMIGALSAIKDSHYSLRIEAVQGAVEEKQALESLLGSRIEGLFCCNINPTPETDAFFKTATERYDVAVASTNCAFTFPHSRVESDNNGGVAELMEHLNALGHRKIAHLGGDEISEASRERADAFLKCLEAHQLNKSDCPVLQTDWDIEKARQQTRALLTAKDRPTAILCANDSIAASALQVAHELKIQVPERLSVVGMTNERISSLTNPEITTVSIPWEDIGCEAVRSLIESIQAKSADPEGKLVRCESSILARASTAAPAGS
ncbi:MAG: substrate-binding domain-containing protein [Verrucomicrobia bacterium]|nr:substrate-binding domain-containing protein [Verrucomicrobiota bacterium]